MIARTRDRVWILWLCYVADWWEPFYVSGPERHERAHGLEDVRLDEAGDLGGEG